MNGDNANEIIIGEARKNRVQVARVSVADYEGRTYLYVSLWERQDGQASSEAVRGKGGLTLRPWLWKALLPLLEQGVSLAEARETKEPWLDPALRIKP